MSDCGCKDPTAPVLTGDCSGPCDADCGCGPVISACPEPYYADAFPYGEPGCKPVCQPVYFASLKIRDAWNIPACGETAIVTIPFLKSIVIGSQLWAPSYGYFEVTAFDPVTQQITVKNNCLDGNASVGTLVPACAEFIIAPPCCDDSGGGSPSLFPYVALDFLAPPVGGCIDILVTTVNGLAVGKNVQIGSGTYRVSGIAGSGILGICNDGLGITPGTSVVAKNAAGDYQYPVILIDTNPCTTPVVNDGALLACNGGVTQPVTGLSTGMIWVLTDPVTGVGAYQSIGVPTFTCSTLTATLTLSTGVAGYTITVSDSSVFAPTDVLQIGTRTDRFTVTGVPDATHITGTLSPVPGSIQLIPIGTSICLIGCCEDLQGQLDAEIALRDQNQAQLSISQSSNSGANVTVTLNNATPGQVSNPALLTINNPHLPGHDINVMIAMSAFIVATVAGTNTDPLDVSIALSTAKNGGPFTIKAQHAVHHYYDSDAAQIFIDTLNFTAVDAVIPGASDIFRVRVSVTVGSAAGTSSFAITQLFPTISILGVAV